MKSISNTNNRKNSFLKLAASLFGVLFISVTLGCSFIFDELSGGGSGNSNESSYVDDTNIFPDETTGLILYESFENSINNFTLGKLKGTGRITQDEVFLTKHQSSTRAKGVLRDWNQHRNIYELKSDTYLCMTVTVLKDSVVSFNYKSDIYSDDAMSVFVDNTIFPVQKFGGYGKGWNTASINIGVGKHEVKWNIPRQIAYSKQLKNVVYIDNISVVADEVAYVDIYPKGLQETYVNGDPIQFTAKALRGDRSVMEDVNITYSVTGSGSIDSRTGLFSPTQEGVCTVTATAGNITSSNNSVKVHGTDYLSEPVTIAGHKFTGTINYGQTVNTLNINFNTPMPSSADGFFVIKGNTNCPFLINVTKQGSTPKLETTFFVRETGEFYKRIWLRFGAGSYNVFISEISQLELKQPIGDYEGDISKYGYFSSGNQTCAFNVINTNSSMTEEDAKWLMPSEVVQIDSFVVSNVYNNIMSNVINPKECDKLRLFHDWILYNFYYDNVSVNHKEQRKRQDAEHLVKYKTGVCEGYANLYAALVRNAGIPTKVICEHKKMHHAWNHVKYNNNWYLVDVTWDDPITSAEDSYNDVSYGREIYTYFMTAHTDKAHILPGIGDEKRNAEGLIQPSIPKMTNMPDGWY